LKKSDADISATLRIVLAESSGAKNGPDSPARRWLFSFVLPTLNPIRRPPVRSSSASAWMILLYGVSTSQSVGSQRSRKDINWPMFIAGACENVNRVQILALNNLVHDSTTLKKMPAFPSSARTAGDVASNTKAASSRFIYHPLLNCRIFIEGL
jgi:hypothetical protein